MALEVDLPGAWYVAHTRSRNEKVLAQELTVFGIRNYLPLARRVTRSPATGRISRSLAPVFPGYLFFHGTEEDRYRALRTNRVANLLVVPDQAQLIVELLHIQKLLADEGAFAVVQRIRVGDWGRIIAGPLVGLEGVVTRSPGRWRLTLNVTILGQSVSVEVDAANVERIDPPHYAVKAPRARERGS